MEGWRSPRTEGGGKAEEQREDRGERGGGTVRRCDDISEA